MPVVAVQVVDATNFIAFNRASKEALKSANLLKSMEANVLIEGEAGVGKITLAKIITSATIVDGSESIERILKLISGKSEIVIKNFNKIKNIDLLHNFIKDNHIRVVATSRIAITDKLFDKFFSIKIVIPPLKDRQDDIYPIAKKFLDEAVHNFALECNIDLKNCELSIEKNCYSLKMSVYKAVIEQYYDEQDILKMMENILDGRLDSINTYRENLYLYDVPIIRAALKKFKSQLRVANELGINRNTLRKKINELKQYF